MEYAPHLLSVSVCRNPDGDKMPWCYTLSDGAISWEYCDVPSCRMAVCEYMCQQRRE